MPTYEYRCERCGDTVEVVQSFADAPLTTCSSCGGPLRKVFAPVGIVFKGSGFYKTDSRSSSKATSSVSSTSSDGAAKDGGDKAESTTKKDGASGGTDATSAGGAPSTTPAAKPAASGSAPKPSSD
jgi:putative FmdB family regulatory protein